MDIRTRTEGLDESIQREVWLVEERGVAGYAWKKEIDAIVDWIRRRIKQDKINVLLEREITFDVPEKLCEMISFIRNLSITVNASPLAGNEGRSGGGKLSIGIINEPIKIIRLNEININCYYDKKGNLKTKTFLNSFYHEINHAFDAYCRAYRHINGLQGYLKTVGKYNHDADLAHGIQMIMYRLFSEIELNAAISSVYGDLRGMESKRENFHIDISETQAYWIYRDIKSRYVNMVDSLTDSECQELYKDFKSKGIVLNMVSNRVSSFKNALKHKIEIQLGKLSKGIGRAASLWYDEQEDQEWLKTTQITTL